MISPSNDMQQIKRQFFAMRNSIIAESFRRNGIEYKTIYGLNLPQITEIAGNTPHSAALAYELWEDRSTRESLLLAPMIYPCNQFSYDDAITWVAQTPNTEVADILCHKLLRHLNYAWQLATALIKSPTDMEHYVALRLMFNLLPANTVRIKEYAQEESHRDCPLTQSLCHQLLTEIGFLNEQR